MIFCLFHTLHLKFFRRNDNIRAPRLRVIDEEGTLIGVLSRDEALRMAKERELDLIEISPKAEPPVCKIDDFGSFSFRKKKAEKKQKNASKKAELKSLRFGIRISENDLQVKINKARKFLEKNHPVKILLQFKGRENAHEDIGLEKMKIFINELEDISKPESTPKKQGNRIMVTLKAEKPVKKIK